MSDDIKQIEAVLQTYFDGLYEGDSGKLAAAFHETGQRAAEWFFRAVPAVGRPLEFRVYRLGGTFRCAGIARGSGPSRGPEG